LNENQTCLPVGREIKAICQPEFFAVMLKCIAHLTKNSLGTGWLIALAIPYTKSPFAAALS